MVQTKNRTPVMPQADIPLRAAGGGGVALFSGEGETVVDSEELVTGVTGLTVVGPGLVLLSEGVAVLFVDAGGCVAGGASVGLIVVDCCVAAKAPNNGQTWAFT